MSALLLVVAADAAEAQDDEAAGGARGGYAWGDSASGAAEGDDPLRIMAFAGVGIGFRPLRNLDFGQEFSTPAYLDLGAAVFAPGGDLRHGGGITVTTNLASDVSSGVPSFEQWVLTPSYHLLIPLRRLMPDLQHDWVQLQGRIGIPLVFSTPFGGAREGMDFSVGGELAVALHFKFLAGLGLYLEVTAAAYGGSSNTVHPIISTDFGLLFDYEVLP